jgi:hypothetical protein
VLKEVKNGELTFIQNDTVMLGKDEYLRQEGRKVIPMMVNKLDNEVRLTERDAAASLFPG